MKALIRKEVRDLSVSFCAVLGTAVVLALIDLAYNYQWARYEGLAVSIWAVLAFVMAFLGGAGAFARESRQNMVFLSSWPYKRVTLWGAKALVSALLTFTAITLGFLICLSVVDFSSGSADLQTWVAPETWTALGYGLPLCFAFALLWSTLLSPILAAAGLGLVTLFALAAGYVYVLGFYLPTAWGPYFGEIETSVTLWKGCAVMLSMLALATAGYAFVRLPVLETRRRLWRALGTLLVLSVLALAGMAGWQYTRTPSLAQPLRAESLGLVGDSVCFGTSASPTDVGGVWALPLTGSTPRLLAKGNPWYDDACGNSVYLGYGPMLQESITWSADTATRALRRLPERFRMGSPDGRYTVIQPPKLFKHVIYDGNRPVATVPQEGGPVFSPDSRYAYYLAASVSVTRLDLQTRQTQSIIDIPGVSFLQQVSPDGRYLVAQATGKPRPSGAESSESTLLILDLQTRCLYRFPNLSATLDSFLDNRHLVVRHRPFGPEGPAVFYFLDTATMRIANARPLWGFSTGSTPQIAHHIGVPYAVVHVPVKSRGATPAQFHLWRLNPDGSGLRDLGEQQGEVLGMAPDGKVIIWDRERSFTSYDPRTGERRHIATIGAGSGV
ncbi:MAG: hypothetical protein ABFE08_21480 [Armatimonadia bacterium]